MTTPRKPAAEARTATAGQCFPFPLYQAVAGGTSIPLVGRETLLRDVVLPLAEQAAGIAFCCHLALSTPDAQGSQSEKVNAALELLMEQFRIVAELTDHCVTMASESDEGRC